MRRPILLIAGFFLQGAVVNVAVAWMFALTIDLSYGQPPAADVRFSPDGMHAVSVWSRFAGQHVFDQRSKTDPAHSYSETSPGTDPNALIPAWSGLGKPSPKYVAASGEFAEIRGAEARGWPMLSMRWDWFASSEEDLGNFTPPPMHIVGGIETSWKQQAMDGTLHPCVLPLRPIWPNFAVNTVFYALLAWMTICGPGVLRRRRRRRRGCCINCGYDLRGVSGERCPECGRDRTGRMK